ncbi:MAG: hypothetical protein J6K17_05205 [Oscillospiraceae bacterium]|nr:hypothetical protein [Oscillospiraceae bacterium]
MARSKELTVKRFVRTKRGIIPIEEITPEEREIWQKNVTDRLSITFSRILSNNRELLEELINEGAFE